MTLRELQELMMTYYGEKDKARGIDKTTLWLVSELGELAEAIRTQNTDNIQEEIADVLAWLLSLGNVLEIDVEKCFYRKYGDKCPRCGNKPCNCLE